MAVPFCSEGNTDRNSPSQCPINPPSELVQRWTQLSTENGLVDEEIFAAHASQWGADQELEACCKRQALLYGNRAADELRAARSPRPPSLKEQALALLQPGETRLLNREQQDVIRQALEALPDD